MRADLRIPRQANSHDYWREVETERFRKSPASAREGQWYKLDLRESI